VLSAPFRAQVISLSALPGTYDENNVNLLCPVRALRIYVQRSAAFRQSKQLFVSFGGRTKGLATLQSISRWIVETIALTYKSKGLKA